MTNMYFFLLFKLLNTIAKSRHINWRIQRLKIGASISFFAKMRLCTENPSLVNCSLKFHQVNSHPIKFSPSECPLLANFRLLNFYLVNSLVVKAIFLVRPLWLHVQASDAHRWILDIVIEYWIWQLYFHWKL